jgi:hypothetical protein
VTNKASFLIKIALKAMPMMAYYDSNFYSLIKRILLLSYLFLVKEFLGIDLLIFPICLDFLKEEIRMFTKQMTIILMSCLDKHFFLA